MVEGSGIDRSGVFDTIMALVRARIKYHPPFSGIAWLSVREQPDGIVKKNFFRGLCK